MAEPIDETHEFWLPSDFLDDTFFSKPDNNTLNQPTPAETESDEEDHLAGLYPKVAAGSPQSTLCDLAIWSTDSNKGSPEGPSQVSSPPITPLERQNDDDAWDLLTAAAGQVVRLQLNEQTKQPKFHGRGLLRPPQNLSTPPPQQAERFYQLQQQQFMKQQLSAAWGRHQRSAKGTGGARTLGLPNSAWPPLQKQHPQPGSGMRAVFLTGSGSRESSGTGVFLPRRPGNPSDLRKKPACSTVLLPDRVIHALNLNLNDLGAHPRFPGGYVLDQDAMVARGNSLLAQQKLKQNDYHPPQADLRLPAEWTY